MQPELSPHHFPERTVRQVAADARRALVRSGWCPERSRIDRLRCADDYAESETAFGRQLWLFEAQAVDAYQQRLPAWVFGAVEYSIQYGGMEPVADGVFDSDTQRQRLIAVYQGETLRPSLRWRLLQWLVVAFFVIVASTFLFYMAARWLFELP